MKDVRKQLQERQRELVAHDKRKPPDPPTEPEEVDTATDAQLAEISRLETEIVATEESIAANTEALTALPRRCQDLTDLEGRIDNVRTYFDSQLRTPPVGTVLQEEGMMLDSIIELCIKRPPLNTAAEAVGNQVEGLSVQNDDRAGP